MAKLTFIDAGGTETIVNAPEGKSVMQAALENGVVGITAECNGSAACATCHAFFDADLISQLPEMEEHEDDMLDFAATPREAGSRLSCQVPVSDLLDGAIIRIPAEQ